MAVVIVVACSFRAGASSDCVLALLAIALQMLRMQISLPLHGSFVGSTTVMNLEKNRSPLSSGNGST